MTRFERALLWLGTAATAGSGVAYGWMKYFMVSEDPFAVVHHPWQGAMLKLHVLSAPVLVFAIGMIFSRHVVKQWRLRAGQGKRSGSSIAIIGAAMTVSGYLIQTVQADSPLRWVIGAHLVTSGIYLATLVVHQILAWARSRASRPAAQSERRSA